MQVETLRAKNSLQHRSQTLAPKEIPKSRVSLDVPGKVARDKRLELTILTCVNVGRRLRQKTLNIIGADPSLTKNLADLCT